MMTVKSNFGSESAAQNQEDSESAVSPVENKLQEIADIFDEIEDDSFIESGTSKQEILKKWLGILPTKLDDGIVDNQVFELQDKLRNLNASKEDIQSNTIALLDQIKTQVSGAIDQAMADNHPIYDEGADDDHAAEQLSKTESYIESMDDTLVASYEDGQELLAAQNQINVKEQTISSLEGDKEGLLDANEKQSGVISQQGDTITNLKSENIDIQEQAKTQSIRADKAEQRIVNVEERAEDAEQIVEKLEQQAEQLAQKTEAEEQYKQTLQSAKKFYRDFNVTKGQMIFMQETLIANGYGLPKYGADGDFGKESFDAVINLQADKGLVQDGKMGDNTFAALGFKKAKESDLSQKSEQIIASESTAEEPTTLDNIVDASGEAFDNFTEASGEVYDNVVETTAEAYKTTKDFLVKTFTDKDLTTFIGANGETITLELDDESMAITYDTTWTDGISDSKIDMGDTVIESEEQAIAYINEQRNHIEQGYNAQVLEVAVASLENGTSKREQVGIIPNKGGDYAVIMYREETKTSLFSKFGSRNKRLGEIQAGVFDSSGELVQSLPVSGKGIELIALINQGIEGVKKNIA